MPESTTVPVEQPQQWIALKSRFFLTALASPVPNAGFQFTATRDTARPNYFLKELSARMRFPEKVLNQGETFERGYTFFVGPKKLSLLQSFGNKLDDVMDFGMWSWFCKLLVPTLNGFYRVIPNYGIAIILLTFLVRLIFWPLTRKSTEGMKKMQEIQPIIKELQKKFKDNPQKLQQETFAVYREHKVNPLSSCLPMLIQIPVFIALFYVLRNSVELRYAPFLWIADLSEPENLFAKVLPIPLNILPILMAVTMALQSYLTPSAGDPVDDAVHVLLVPRRALALLDGEPDPGDRPDVDDPPERESGRQRRKRNDAGRAAADAAAASSCVGPRREGLPMPIYEYRCAACGNLFDHLANSYSSPAPNCPACGSSRVEKQLSTFSQTSATPAACRSCPSEGGGHGGGCGCGCCRHG